MSRDNLLRNCVAISKGHSARDWSGHEDEDGGGYGERRDVGLPSSAQIILIERLKLRRTSFRKPLP